MNKKGHWYTDKNGNHYFVEEGQTPKEGWEASKRRKMIKDGKYQTSEDGENWKETSAEEYGKYEADENDFDLNNEDDFGFDDEKNDVDDERSGVDSKDFDKDLKDAYKKYGDDEDAILDELRKSGKDYGMSNSDLQGVVEAYVTMKSGNDFDYDEDYERSWGPKDDEDDEDFIEPYDFDKWAKDTNSKKEDHVAYIDTNKKYDANSIFDIITSDDGWHTQGTMGDKVLFSHDSGPTYTFDKNTGEVELTTRELENEKGKKAHTKELTDYVKNAINKGVTDPEEIYQKSPYSIHSHDEMVEIAERKLAEKPTKETEENNDFENEVVNILKESIEGNNKKIERLNKFLESNKENVRMANDFKEQIRKIEEENDYYNSIIKNPKLMYK